MKQLEIKHLVPYLPYDLGLLVQDDEVCNLSDRYNRLRKGRKCTMSSKELEIICSLEKQFFKPILYQLDYLTKEITHNGETFVPIEWLEDKYYTLNYREQCLRLLDEDGHNWINQTDYMLVQQLIEWRFDVFNLINDGLAIPVTEDFNPYK